MGLWLSGQDELVFPSHCGRDRLAALEVGARITSADQKCFEIPATGDEGLDMDWNSPTTTAKAPGAGSTCN